MKYLDLKVKTAIIAHGYDSENKLAQEKPIEETFMRKLIAVDRIRSISEEYILVSSQNGREMYWEYEGSLEDIKSRLQEIGVAIA